MSCAISDSTLPHVSGYVLGAHPYPHVHTHMHTQSTRNGIIKL